MSTKKILAISAGLSQPSSTRLLADRLAEASKQFLAEDGFDIELDIVEVRDVAQQVTNNLITGFAAPELAAIQQKVIASDGLIVVSPIFSASYSGLFKSFFDALDTDALAQKPVLIAATGGSERHSLALEHAFRPLFSYLHAVVVPTAVYAASADWGSRGEGSGDEEGELVLRIGRAAREFADLVGRHAAQRDTPEVSSDTPVFEVVPFEQQLAALRHK
jgi:FMN reductase